MFRSKDIDELWIKLEKTAYGTPWSDEVSIGFSEDGNAKIYMSSIVGFEDELGKDKIKKLENRLRKAINKVTNTRAYKKLMNELENISPDNYDIDIDIETYDTLTLFIKIKLGCWYIPPLKLLENVIYRIYKIARIDKFIEKSL